MLKTMKIFTCILIGSLSTVMNIQGETMENAYLNETNFPITKKNYVVISGCSGRGKSTLLSELVRRGYSVVLEPGR